MKRSAEGEQWRSEAQEKRAKEPSRAPGGSEGDGAKRAKALVYRAQS